MTRTDKRVVAALMAVTLLAPAVHAQVATGTTTAGRAAARAIAARTTTSAARAATALNALAGSAAPGANATSVMGYIWTGEGTPLSNSTVQLRNIVTGQIEQVSTTLQNGAFAFQNVSTGTYTIEFVTEGAGRVLAVGQAFSVAPGETVATFVRLSSRLVLDLASNAAQAVVSNVANAVASGVVSIAGTVAPPQPASPLR
jgi:hypothetical protein